MSGGYFNHSDRSLDYELFNYAGDCEEAKRIDPMEDTKISELVFDVLGLIHKLDYYKSGDTDEEDYRKDVKAFKTKWLKLDVKTVENYKADLKDFCEKLISQLDEYKAD